MIRIIGLYTKQKEQKEINVTETNFWTEALELCEWRKLRMNKFKDV